MSRGSSCVFTLLKSQASSTRSTPKQSTYHDNSDSQRTNQTPALPIKFPVFFFTLYHACRQLFLQGRHKTSTASVLNRWVQAVSAKVYLAPYW